MEKLKILPISSTDFWPTPLKIAVTATLSDTGSPHESFLKIHKKTSKSIHVFTAFLLIKFEFTGVFTFFSNLFKKEGKNSYLKDLT